MPGIGPLFRRKRVCETADAGYARPMNARDELLDFLVGQIPRAALAGFQASDQARERVWALIAKEKETGLKLEHLLVLAKAKARLAAGQA
jgi:hypothetical protein